jgi:SAM-dependent methyltransferase
VAIDSPDHLHPWGTRRDNSRNRRFNQKLYRLFNGLPTLRVLDLGCSGGGFVKDCLDDGHLAVGLEGSDYSRRMKRAEWGTIPDFLFTCDVTAEFNLTLDGEPLAFNVATSWELIEHIVESDLTHLSANVENHLTPDGIWVMSISPNREVKDGVDLHQTVQGEEWWIETFAGLGWTNLPEYVRYFNTQFVRGPKYGAPGSFHLVLRRQSSHPPLPPPARAVEYCFDRWHNSAAHRIVKLAIIGPA